MARKAGGVQTGRVAHPYFPASDSLGRLLGHYSFFRDLNARSLRIVAAAARAVRFHTGEVLFQEGDNARWFYVIRRGKVALEVPGMEREARILQALEAGDVLGWSWLFPPYRWHFDARSLTPVTAIALDGKRIRERCESDHHLGYELLRRFARVMMERLHATRLQLLDIRGAGAGLSDEQD